jgi:hypothetical protein
MKDISYHILDIVQNSLNAGADKIFTGISENSATGKLTLTIRDNGKGMNESLLNKVVDPFFTSSVTKKVGLGLPLLKQNAELTGGTFTLDSKEGKGTTVTVVFNYTHIDMIPTGDIGMTYKTLIAMNPEKNFEFRYEKDGQEFILNTAEVRDILGETRIDSREVLDYIAGYINENQEALSQ